MKIKTIISWILRLTVAIILLQTLFYKFTAHPDSVHIFTELHAEPWGRITLGFIELITAILILLPKTKTYGMVISFFIILGAIFSHLLVIGVNVSGDGGRLFLLAIIVAVASLAYMILNYKDVKLDFQNLLIKKSH